MEHLLWVRSLLGAGKVMVNQTCTPSWFPLDLASEVGDEKSGCYISL